MDFSSGLPKGRPSRKLPTPFSRPRISVRGVEDKVIRDWQWCWPEDLHDGDIIVGHGVVLSVERRIEDYLVRVGIPEGPPLVLNDAQQVWAFSHVKEE